MYLTPVPLLGGLTGVPSITTTGQVSQIYQHFFLVPNSLRSSWVYTVPRYRALSIKLSLTRDRSQSFSSLVCLRTDLVTVQGCERRG